MNNLEKLGGCIAALLMVFLVALIMCLPTMWLWNWLMPTLFGLTRITWIQALGINFLSSILFKSNVSVNTKS